MTDLLSWMPSEIGRELGWTLIHFLWQGFLLAALLHAILPRCRNAIVRHNCALATLVLMALAPVATFLSIHNLAKSGGLSLAAGPLPSAAAPWTVWLVTLWLAGVAALSLRALGGWYLVQCLRRFDTLAVPADLLRRCHDLQRRLTVTGPVRFLLSRRIDVPVVIGWLRPVILIPVSAVSGLGPHQLDALILHELAHIRRLDTVINILLVAVETILFYHPAVWWVSRHVRVERENCCDDFAVSACGDVGLYVEALTTLETWKGTGGMALAANGGGLKQRVARLLDAPAQSPRFSLSAMTGLALLGLVATSLAVAQTQMPKANGAYPSSGKNPVMLQPIMETHQLPPYPKQSLHDREEGRVLVEVTIGTDGAVSQAAVVGPSGHQRLDAAAANFVKGYWRWQPPTRAGKPVTTNTRVSVLFKLGPKPSAKR
ncbi:MAG TPA: M56 family metallopeptidase [Rhizomicrobium sp.]|nr:M56 family metallopeptidase [Rhizomicrobium sp.]